MLDQFKMALKSPLTYALIFVSSIASFFISVYVNKTNADDEKCQKRVDALEKRLDDYVQAVLFKDEQIKNRDVVIDSLKRNPEK